MSDTTQPNQATSETLLVVDDSPATLEVLRRNLSSRGYRVLTAPGAEDAVAVLEREPVDLVVTDMKMPRISGLDLVRHIRENRRDLEVMMITGYASIQGAVDAVKSGAGEYLAKPFTDEELFAAVDRSLERLHERRRRRAASVSTPRTPSGLLGTSKAMKPVFRAIARAAGTTATVLITGESGTGKELVARAIHYSGSRAASPFVPVNCGGIPETLLESELFGHVKGAFTGAVDSRAGFFQTADGGTIFLDEVGEMSATMQVKLLRVLQDRQVYMVGSTKPREVDLRIIAATHRELMPMVRRGAFREDLYYRLNVLPIELPPLRQRGEDITLLVRHFMERYCREVGRDGLTLSPDAHDALVAYPWPGNVREVENLIQRLVVMCEGNTIEVADLPSHMRFSIGAAGRNDRTLAQVEAEHIQQILQQNHGNKSRAAKTLGIDRKTLREKLKTYGISDADEAP